ncbi:MAG TPA: OsmC family protein [Planctomycetota bacterium]|nr:OsmC family protein [Planctomycetota bacterium]
MAVEITGVYEGELKVRVAHGPSKASFVTEAPADNGGKGQSFSPTDLVATALGSCMLTIMGIVAERDGIPLRGARVRVEKHMSLEPRRIGRLPVVFDMPAGLTPEQRRKLEAAANGCPVKRSLHPDVDHPVTFNYPD